MADEELIARVQRVCTEYGVSKSRLADLASVSRGTIHNFETGQNPISPATRRLLGEALDRIEDDRVHEDDQAPKPSASATRVANLNEQLAQAVIDERMRRKMSQSALGRAMKAAGFSAWFQQTVARVESCQRAFRFDEAIAIAAVLDIDLSQFKVSIDVCSACFNTPPAGFTCNTCGRPS